MAFTHKIMKNYICILLFLLNSYSIYAQEQKGVRIEWENDVFQVRKSSITDRNFTNGLKISLLGNFWHKLPTSFLLIKPKNLTSHLYSFAIGQHIYTPTKLDTAAAIWGDRPYAGWLYLSNSLIACNANEEWKIISEFDLGVIGSLSGAGELQRSVHKAFNWTEPKGWGNQIRNSPGVNYYVNFEKRAMEQFSKGIDLLYSAEGHVGTVTNFIGVGALLRVGVFNDYFLSPTNMKVNNENISNIVKERYKKFENTKNDSINSNSIQRYLNNIRTKYNQRLQAFFFIRPMFRTVLDNSFLQGGWFTKHEGIPVISSDSLKRFYANVEFGGTVSLDSFQLSFSQCFRTPEFLGAVNQQWGKITLTILFDRSRKYLKTSN